MFLSGACALPIPWPSLPGARTHRVCVCLSEKLTGEFKEFIFHALPKVFLDKDKNVAKVQTSKCLSAPLLCEPLWDGDCIPRGSCDNAQRLQEGS